MRSMGANSNAANGIPMYPEGCAVSPKCGDCPLLDCYETYRGVGSLGKMAVAILAAWDAGVRHPLLLPSYRGPQSRVPQDIWELVS